MNKLDLINEELMKNILTMFIEHEEIIYKTFSFKHKQKIFSSHIFFIEALELNETDCIKFLFSLQNDRLRINLEFSGIHNISKELFQIVIQNKNNFYSIDKTSSMTTEEYKNSSLNQLVNTKLLEIHKEFEEIINDKKDLIKNSIQTYFPKNLFLEEKKTPLIARIEDKIIPALLKAFKELPEEEQLKKMELVEHAINNLNQRVKEEKEAIDKDLAFITFERQLAIAVGFSKI